MNMAAYLLLATLVFLAEHCSSTLIKWNMNAKVDDKSIGMNYNLVKGMEIGNASKKYTDLVSSLKNYTLDEKCENGHAIGVGYQVYTPYVDIGFSMMGSVVISGILPHITNELMKECCKKSNVTFGHFFKSILEIEEHFEKNADVDFSFPIYGLNGKASERYKDFPFVPVVTAPRVALLVPDRLFQERNTRTKVLMKTICNSWPMLGFIVVSACLAGLTVWVLDKEHNSTEFPPTFFSGAWDGIWWAFVTMTTVGYGDRSPKSLYARAFSIIWILMGIILISLFTGLVSVALYASATPVFKLAGAKIGAVRGSIEFQIGVGWNAEMKAFDNHAALITSLVQENNLHGVLIDNFILSASQGILQKTKLRIEREIEKPVTYGIVLKNNSTRTEKCIRRYIRNHPQKVFETIAEYLKPVKNPTDDVRLEVVAAEKLFYEESVFKTVVYTESGLLIAFLVAGTLWEILVRNKNSAAYKLLGRFRHKPELVDTFLMEGQSQSFEPIEKLITEYDEFHYNWIAKVRNLSNGVKTNGLVQKIED